MYINQMAQPNKPQYLWLNCLQLLWQFHDLLILVGQQVLVGEVLGFLDSRQIGLYKGVYIRFTLFHLIGTSNLWSGNLQSADSPANPTTACQECFELLDVSNQSNHSLSNSSRSWVRPEWPYCQQAWCGCWFTWNTVKQASCNRFLVS